MFSDLLTSVFTNILPKGVIDENTLFPLGRRGMQLEVIVYSPKRGGPKFNSMGPVKRNEGEVCVSVLPRNINLEEIIISCPFFLSTDQTSWGSILSLSICKLNNNKDI